MTQLSKGGNIPRNPNSLRYGKRPPHIPIYAYRLLHAISARTGEGLAEVLVRGLEAIATEEDREEAEGDRIK